ncbi:hypothetical protein [Sorangium sp. So ce406]|uniref:hypothetical protein n=1 Tax=Sorangium sp. So ce406 TaxID=3133311 RepID=UPI003F5BE7A5
MNGKWLIGMYPTEIWVVRHGSATIPYGADRIDPVQAAWSVEEWFPYSRTDSHAFAEICASIEGEFSARRHVSSAQVVERIREAFRLGVLHAYRPGTGASAAGLRGTGASPGARAKQATGGVSSHDRDDNDDDGALSRPLPPRSVVTWVELSLVGEDDMPIPGEQYRIELPDGSVRDGRLDSRGLARIDGIDPGTCSITFPALDQDAWTRI